MVIKACPKSQLSTIQELALCLFQLSLKQGHCHNLTCSIFFATFFKQGQNQNLTCSISFSTYFKTSPKLKPQELNSELVDPSQPWTSCKPVHQDRPCASFQFDKFYIGILYTRIGPVLFFSLIGFVL